MVDPVSQDQATIDAMLGETLLDAAPHAPRKATARLLLALNASMPVWLKSLLLPPSGLLPRVRWLFCLWSQFAFLSLIPVLLVFEPAYVDLRAPAILSIAWLCGARLVGYRRGRFGALETAAEGGALLIIAVAIGAPLRALAVLYFSLYFRSLYGSWRQVLSVCLLHYAAYLAAGFSAHSELLPIWDIVGQLPGMVLAASIMYLLVAALTKHERAAKRESVLRRFGTALTTNAQLERIYAVTLEAATSMAMPVAARVRIAVGSGDCMFVVADGGPGSDGEIGTGTAVDLRLASDLARAELRRGCLYKIGPCTAGSLPSPFGDDVAGRWCCVVPLLMRTGLRGMLIVTSDEALPDDTKDGLLALGVQVALVLESAVLTDELRENEARFRSLVQNSSDVITTLDSSGTIRYQTPAIKRVFGYGSAELVGTKFVDLLHPDDVPHAARYLAELGEHSGLSAPVGWRLRHRNGAWLQVETIGNNLRHDPHVRSMVLNTRDISERRVLEAQLAHQAFHDSLTKLPNRAFFVERLSHALARVGRHQRSVAVLFLDLDRFKIINDSLGHVVGDQLLITVAERLQTCVRAHDTAARLGGDEFTVLLEDIVDVRDAIEVAERIAEMLQAPVQLNGHQMCISTSIGIVVDSGHGNTSEDLLRCADVALYQAKKQGKARYAIFDPAMNQEVIERLSLESDLRRALECQQLLLHYQPIVDLATGRMEGVEALIRWLHPNGSLVSPAKFIPIAEETGLILPIGAWVLETACAQMRQWQQQFPQTFPLVISVNLSALQFQHPRLGQDIAHILRQTGLAAQSLKLEITESVLMESGMSTLTILQELKSLGVRLAIDDFGTGYSSLAYLKRFPIDVIKIDRSFVDRLAQDPEDAAIVQAITTLAKTMSLTVTAEGVETAEQLAMLRKLGCENGQGYHFARPLAGDALTGLLARGGITAGAGAVAQSPVLPIG